MIFNFQTSALTRVNCDSLEEEEEERKRYFNNLLHIHQHTFLRYMIQSVIEGKIRRQICLYDIPLLNKINI